MAHHGDEWPGGTPDFINEFLKKEAQRENLGATKRFPQGQLNSDDEGELRMGVARAGRKVILNFGKPVEWIGFDAEQAESLAELLKQHAREARNSE